MSEFDHSQSETLGILLTNLGTPKSAAKHDVRAYLKEFLSDQRVIKMPKLLWWPILNLIILNTRSKRSAKAYAKIWTDQGSPLLAISKQQAAALQAAFGKQQVKVVLGMRYGSPSIAQALDELRNAGATKILAFPLYPQYSATTTASTFDAITTAFERCNWLPELRFINHYHDNPAYINTLAKSVLTHWKANGRAEKLLMSFHGIPQEYFLDGDPYHCECQKTGRLLAKQLELDESQWLLTFQSRLGPKQWLKPYTDKTLKQLAKVGAKTLDIICPGFSADCLETLEEIAIDNKASFLAAGGEDYRYIDCLNASQEHISTLQKIAQSHMQGWAKPPALSELSERKQRADKASLKG